jgi:hypothetical protein
VKSEEALTIILAINIPVVAMILCFQKHIPFLVFLVCSGTKVVKEISKFRVSHNSAALDLIYKLNLTPQYVK